MSRIVFDEYRKNKGFDEKHTNREYTPESCVKDMIKFVPIIEGDIVLDCSCGINKVWLNNFPTINKIGIDKDFGDDFMTYNERVDWVISNPPFTNFIEFCFKSSEICNKGFAFLINHSRINQVTPRRLERLKEKGFYLNEIIILSISKWFGRFYFLVFTKNKSESINWSLENYK